MRTSALALALVACNADRIAGPRAVPLRPPSAAHNLANGMPDVRVSEFHYDNVSGDVGEFVELSAPAGQDLTGWSLVLYNGSNGTSYSTTPLSGAVPVTPACGTRGVLVLDYPSDGVQNGAPDGIAVVDGGGHVVEFLSYEGQLTASNGPAAGTTSTDIGVSETGSTPVGSSLQRQPDGTWHAPAASTKGACNDDDSGEVGPPATVATVEVTPAEATVEAGQTQAFHAVARDDEGASIPGATFDWAVAESGVASVDANGVVTTTVEGDVHVSAISGGVTGAAVLHVAPATPVTLPDVRFSELHYDNAGVDAGERIEIEGPAGASIAGWSLVLYDGNGGDVYGSSPLSGAIVESCTGRGVVLVDYPPNGLQNGSPDGIALVDDAGHVVEFLSYEGAITATAGPAAGMTSQDIGVSEASSAAANGSVKRAANGSWTAPSPNNFGSVNACGGPVLDPPPSKSLTFSGRDAGDPPLPIGFEAQIFANESVNGVDTPTTITWTSETPEIASIDANGVMRALAAGSGTVRATAADGTTATYSLPTAAAVFSTTAQYAGQAEFGEPADADASDDYLVRRPQYTLSYNRNRGTPNWVSYRLDVTDYGSEDRCNCFTHDPLLPAAFPHFTTADYTGAGAVAGYGIDRGHMARSFDRTAASGDNATTYYLSNIVPQAADLNQGPWAIMENYLGDLARQGDQKEVYIVDGVAGSIGTVKNEGRITIPAQTWKVALILPHGHGLGDVHSTRDLEVVAAIMPNQPGVRNVDWTTYRTTVGAVEQLTGYDLFALLPDNVEHAVEIGDHSPQAVVDGPAVGDEGSALTFTAGGSSDPDVGDALTYAWSFGDGTTAVGASARHTYADNGTFTVTLTVTDSHGVADETTHPVAVANVAPVITHFTAPATASVNDHVTAQVSFTDAGSADTHDAIVSWGDGSSSSVQAGSGTSASASHRYARPGFYDIGVVVRDDDGATATAGSPVVVYDADAGRVSADGWIPGSDDARDRRHDRDRTQFEVDARYDRRGGSPDGRFELRDRDAQLIVRGRALDYLVVQDATAYMEGSGNLRNGDDVGFIVVVRDGKLGGNDHRGDDDRHSSPDLARIKVWSRTTGEVLFDTQPGDPDHAAPTTPLGGGSVTIHR